MKKTIHICLILWLLPIVMVAQDSVKKVGLVWDTSYGMINRNLEAEINYLNDYFLENRQTEVLLTIFSNTILAQESYKISNAEWTDLRDQLETSIPDGATSFTNIFPRNVDEILLFTDGKSAYGSLPTSFEKPITVVYSVAGGNLQRLQNLADNSGGKLINLLDDERERNKEIIKVTGTVSTLTVPLEGVRVESRELGVSTTTDKNGKYEIEAAVDGSIKFSLLGKKTYIARTPPNGQRDIILEDGNETLDEILITADRRPEEKPLNLGVVKRPERSIGYAVETIDETQISPQDIDLETAITGQFSNVQIKSDEDISQFLSRGRNMSILLDQTGLLVIDGVPMQSDPKFLGGVSTDKAIISKSGLLHPDNIAEITVLKGLAATNRWGTLGRNGVILVTTKAGSQLATEDGEFNNDKIGTTDTYEGGALLMEDLPNTEYIEALSTAKTVDEAYNIYLQQRGYFGDSPEFFFNTSTYFKKWENNFVIDKILSNVSELPDVDTETQMALVYKLQEMGLYDSATKVINNIIEDKPTQLQHYRNLALNYRLAGEYQKSLDLYKKIDRKQIKGITSLDNLQGTIDNEYKNLLALHSDDIEMKGINPKMLTNVKLDTRIVFEWNNFDAEFDLQIVNPQNRYFTWSHTKEGEPSRINKEKQLGYGLEEYFMTVDDKGIWLFNITYYGDGDGNSNEPLYLKVTKYDNFGSINQSQHTEVIAIEEVDKTQTLMTIKI